MKLRANWPTMGSVASLVVPLAPGGPSEAELQPIVARVRGWLEEVEAALSPYRADSDLVRWREGRSELAGCSPLLAEVLADVDRLVEATAGGFHPYDRSGRYDPTGYVKGWAVQRGVALLAGEGIDNACLGIGGDVQTLGNAEPGRPWRVAVVDPAVESRVISVIEAPGSGPFAAATSGESQRGAHIWGADPAGRILEPSPGAGRTALASVTVVGPELRLADAYATAVWALAAGRPLDRAWAFLEGTGYDALAVDTDAGRHLTQGMALRLVRPAGLPLQPVGVSPG